jgi:predicted methyltransferase
MSTPFEQLASLDRLIHDPARLAILTALSWTARRRRTARRMVEWGELIRFARASMPGRAGW